MSTRKYREAQGKATLDGHLHKEKHQVFTKQGEVVGQERNHRPRLQEAYHPLVVRVTVTRATTVTAPEGTQGQRSPVPEQEPRPGVLALASHP